MDDGRTAVAGAVLAAGAGTRLGRPKAEVVLGGQRLLDRAVEVLVGGGCEPVLAVVRSGTVVPAGVRALVNPDPDRGMRSSLALAVAAAEEAPALALLLVDLPGITPVAVRAVVSAWRPGRIAVGVAGDRQGHPIVMAPMLWREALELAGPDEGARALLARDAHLVDAVPMVIDPRDADDIDTPADLAARRRRIATIRRRADLPHP